MIINIIGWCGTLCLAGAGLPQLYKTLIDGHGLGLHWYYLILIFFGLISMISYVLFTSHSIQLLCSYSFQLIVFSILIWRKKYPKEPMIY